MQAEVIVVGAGVMGSATAHALARDGRDVLLVEQFQVGHDRGSSHGRSRIVRLAYPEVEFVELAKEAFAGWRELEQESGQELLELNGLLELVEEPGQSSQGALDAAGADYELLDAERARARWPVGVPDGWTALFQPEAGIVRADLAQRAFVDCAVARGVRLEEGRRVELLDELDASAVVVTAGPWVTRFFPDVPVRTTRETVAYFQREGDPLPSVVQLDPETRGHAMYSLHDPVYGLKAGAHHAGAVVDPDESGEPDPALVERIAEWVARTYPDAEPEPVAAETCMYATTADEHFILERRGKVVIGSACSGHGFKFAPVIGTRLAALAADIL
ncbi:MAG: FAD-dependent oxidoreductase [Actinobacteria bacterium]|nr:FAD-dependent oxidoreductase [Actinomycetota bacterium]